MQIIEDSCNEMIANYQSLDKTSRKIKALSRILPFLIQKEDKNANNIILEFIFGSLDFSKVDQATSQEFTNQDRFKSQFNMERVVEIVESTPIGKSFIKDELLASENGAKIQAICDFLNNVSLVDVSSEANVYRYKLANTYILKFLCGLLKNHPAS